VPTRKRQRASANISRGGDLTSFDEMRFEVIVISCHEFVDNGGDSAAAERTVFFWGGYFLIRII
jgi:hypothetical protein